MTTKTGSSEKQLQLVYQGQFQPLGNFFSEVTTKQQRIAAATEIKNKLVMLFALYANVQLESSGNLNKVQQAILSELLKTLTETVKENYSMLSFEEIQQAFKMTYNGDFGEFNLSAYYGKASVELLHAILKPYRSWRETALFEIREAQREQESKKAQIRLKKERDVQIAIAKEKGFKNAHRELIKLKECLGLGVDLPSPDAFETKITFLGRYARQFLDAGIIEMSKEKQWELYNEAHSLALSEIKKSKGNSHQNTAHLAHVSKISNDLIKGREVKELEVIQKRIARGLVIKSVLPNISSVRANWVRSRFKLSKQELTIQYQEILRLQEDRRTYKSFSTKKGLSESSKNDCIRLARDCNRNIARVKAKMLSSIEDMTEEQRESLPFEISSTYRENGTEVIEIK